MTKRKMKKIDSSSRVTYHNSKNNSKLLSYELFLLKNMLLSPLSMNDIEVD